MGFVMDGGLYKEKLSWLCIRCYISCEAKYLFYYKSLLGFLGFVPEERISPITIHKVVPFLEAGHSILTL